MHHKPLYHFMFKIFQPEIYTSQTPLAIYFTFLKNLFLGLFSQNTNWLSLLKLTNSGCKRGVIDDKFDVSILIGKERSPFTPPQALSQSTSYSFKFFSKNHSNLRQMYYNLKKCMDLYIYEA